jgi:hypothetical protein
MKVNSTLAFTLILLSLMIGAGVVSAAWGYALGREALKGVTQPDSRPIHGAEAPGDRPPQRPELMLLKESDILEGVKARMSGDARNSDTNREPELQSSTNKAAIEVAASSSPAPIVSSGDFPIMDADQDVTLEVRSARQQAGYLLLDVSLQNSGTQVVQFLYSFMNVTDNQGRAFSANTEGLPGQLPPNGQAFSGTVSIPTALLSDAETLSLTLTDYPDQQLRLQVSNIPVVR